MNECNKCGHWCRLTYEVGFCIKDNKNSKELRHYNDTCKHFNIKRYSNDRK